MKLNNSIWKKISNSKNNIENTTNELKQIVERQNKNVLINVKDLSMEYKSLFKKPKLIFKNISFDIYENEIVALVGPNGVGKTTLVEIISEIKKPTSGTIKYNYSTELGQEKVSVQFQDISFPKQLNVKDLLDFSFRINKKDIDLKKLNEMLEVFKLKDLLKTKVAKLSGGQQQRLNVLMALITIPKVLFLDEFTTGLDISIKNQIQSYIFDFAKKNNITIVLISHDIDSLSTLSDRFILLTNNKILVDASKETITKEFNSISEFLYKYIR